MRTEPYSYRIVRDEADRGSISTRDQSDKLEKSSVQLERCRSEWSGTEETVIIRGGDRSSHTASHIDTQYGSGPCLQHRESQKGVEQQDGWQDRGRVERPKSVGETVNHTYAGLTHRTSCHRAQPQAMLRGALIAINGEL